MTPAYSKQAARPIPIDRGQISRLILRILEELPKRLRFRPDEMEEPLWMQRGFDPNRWSFEVGVFDTRDVRGGRVVVPVEVGTDQMGFKRLRQWVAGGKVQAVHESPKSPGQKYKMSVFLNSSQSPQAILDNLSKVHVELSSVLLHEVTHLTDELKHYKENPDSAETYMNRPTEVRAFMQQIVPEVFNYIHRVGRTSWAKMGLWVIEPALEESKTWNRVRKNLTPGSKKVLLKGIVTAVQDALPFLQEKYPGDEESRTAAQRVASRYL